MVRAVTADPVIASEAKQSMPQRAAQWIVSSFAPRNDDLGMVHHYT
jgi:hypothetical protein